MAKICVRNFDFNVELHPNKTSKNTLFLHGNMASNTWWQPTLANWKDTGEGSFIMMEWRGCGKSQTPTTLKEIEIPEMAKDAVAIVKEVSEGPVNIVGHSTGGLIALYAILQEPELFDKVVLLDSVGAQGITLQPELLDAMLVMKSDRSMCSQVMSATINGVDVQSDLFQHILDDAMSVAEVNWKGIPQNLDGIDITAQLQKIYQSTLVLHGDEDAILPIDDSRFLAESLPNARFQVLKGRGHSTNVEDPERFVEILRSFL